MRRYQWRLGQPGYIPKTLLVEVGEVEHDAQVITSANQLSPGIGEAWSSVGRVWELERHAVSKDIGPAPDDAQRAQSCLVENLECIQSRIYSLSSLKVQNRSENALAQTGFQFINRANYLDLSI